MSRSAKDATRFTPNTPHSYARAPSSGASARSSFSPSFQSSTPSSFPTSRPDNASVAETPQAKVARLRAEHLRRKAAQLTSWDRVILRSRNFADAAHRWTIFGILSFSVLAGGLTIFSAIDMIMYNRRKKKDFYARYQELWEQRHAAALAAEASGSATETQLAIIKQERDAQDYHQNREGKGAWARVRSAFSFKGLSDKADGTHSWDQRKELLEAGDKISMATDGPREVLSAIEATRRGGEKELEKQGFAGGPLDQMAANAAEAAPKLQGSSWFSWGRKQSDN